MRRTRIASPTSKPPPFCAPHGRPNLSLRHQSIRKTQTSRKSFAILISTDCWSSTWGARNMLTHYCFFFFFSDSSLSMGNAKTKLGATLVLLFRYATQKNIGATVVQGTGVAIRVWMNAIPNGRLRRILPCMGKFFGISEGLATTSVWRCPGNTENVHLLDYSRAEETFPVAADGLIWNKVEGHQVVVASDIKPTWFPVLGRSWGDEDETKVQAISVPSLYWV